jgi:hypothetical protein
MIKNDFFVSCFYSNYVRTVRIGQDQSEPSGSVRTVRTVRISQNRQDRSGSVRTVSIDQNGQDRQDGTGPILTVLTGSDRSWPIRKVLTSSADRSDWS